MSRTVSRSRWFEEMLPSPSLPTKDDLYLACIDQAQDSSRRRRIRQCLILNPFSSLQSPSETTGVQEVRIGEREPHKARRHIVMSMGKAVENVVKAQ